MKWFMKTIAERKVVKVVEVVATNLYLLFVAAQPVWAGSLTADTAPMDNVMNFMLTWVIRIGIAVAIFGGIEFGFAYSNDNPDSKNRALRHMASGFIIAGIAKAPAIFGF